MMEIIDAGSDFVLGIRMDGKIEIEDMNRVSTRVQEMLEEHDKIRIYVELESLGGITLEALWEDMKLGLQNFRHFSHKVVVTDKEWIGKVTPFLDRLFPSIKLRVFGREEREAALAWVRADED